MLRPESKALHWERTGYTPHPGQVDFHTSDARFKALTCGRRFGKTQAGVAEIGPLVYIPDAYIWIVAPTKDLGVKEFRLFKRDLEKLHRAGHLYLKKAVLDPIGGRYLLQVRDGATIEVKTQEKEDQIVGEGLVGVIMAEAARLKPHIWTELVRPTLTDYHGVAVFSTTPRGRNWYYYLVEANKDNRNWAVFRRPSWDNPTVYPGGIEDPEIVELKNDTPEAEFLQEYGADFVTHAGLVYDEFSLDIHVREFDLLPDVPVGGWVDVGFNDPFVCLATQVHDEVAYIHDEYYFQKMTPSEHAERLRPWFGERSGAVPEYLYCDPRSPDGIKDLRKADWEAKAAPSLDRRSAGDNPVAVGVKRVKRLLRPQKQTGKPRLFVHPRCTWTIKEFGLYEWVNNDPDPKKNNHCMDAIRYGVLAEVLRERPSVFDGDDDEDSGDEEVLGCETDAEEPEDSYDTEESFMIQRLRQRAEERRRRDQEKRAAGVGA